MTVKKPIPCSFFDIPGMQQWLDEMALQGLFLQDFTRQMDKAVLPPGPGWQKQEGGPGPGGPL